jgi:hypothetical protein
LKSPTAIELPKASASGAIAFGFGSPTLSTAESGTAARMHGASRKPSRTTALVRDNRARVGMTPPQDVSLSTREGGRGGHVGHRDFRNLCAQFRQLNRHERVDTSAMAGAYRRR